MPNHDRFLPERTLAELEKNVPPGETPLWRHWEAFCRRRKQLEKSSDTTRNVRSCLVFLLSRTDRLSIEAWLDPNASCETLLDLKEKLGWKPSTYNSYVKRLGTYFRFLERNGLAPSNPVSRMDRVPEPPLPQPVASEDSMEKAFEACGDLESTPLGLARNRLYFMLCAMTGARTCELLRLTLGSFSSGRASVTILGGKQAGKAREYPLDDRARGLLSDYLAEAAKAERVHELSTSLFVSSSKRGKSWGREGPIKLYRRIRKKTGLNVTTYMFRRYAATALSRAKVPIDQIQDFLGHTRASTTRRYIQDPVGSKKDCAELLRSLHSVTRSPRPTPRSDGAAIAPYPRLAPQKPYVARDPEKEKLRLAAKRAWIREVMRISADRSAAG